MNYRFTFNLSTDTPGICAALEDKIQRVLDDTPMETEGDLETAVQQQLNRITMSPVKLHRSTAEAVALAATHPSMSIDSVFGTEGVVKQTTFYSKKKDWIHNSLYREIIETMIALYRKWDAGESVRKRNKDRQAWIERMHHLSSAGADLIEEMVNLGLHDIETRDEDGTPVLILHPKYRISDIGTLLTAVDKTGRMALNLHTDKTQQDIGGVADQPVEVKRVGGDEEDEARAARLLAMLKRTNTASETAVSEDADD